MIESQLLSKVIDENSFYILTKHNIQQGDFVTYPHVFEYVKEYVKEYGQTPSFQNVVGEFQDFDYQPNVNDAYAYMAKQLKQASGKRVAALNLQSITKNFQEMQGDDFADWLLVEAQNIKRVSDASTSTGTNYATNGQERKEWYEESKENRSGIYIPTPWASLTEWLGGGWELGDGSMILAFTNKGKSWLSSDCARVAHQAGFGVLYYSPELSDKQQSFRLDTLQQHFDNVKLRRGNLDNEEEYFKYLEQFNDSQEVPFIIKTMKDLPKGLSLEVIEADLQANPNVKMVVIDGFNLMNHGKGGRDGVTNTSRKLRQLWGRYGVHGMITHQTPSAAEKEGKSNDDEIEETLSVPQLTDYSEAVATIQDNATVLTFNQKDGIGKMLLAKAREPKVGNVLDLRCNFNVGFITEATPMDIFG